ncbi:MAG: hypothetical protein WC867_01140 [Candidatus Pacearchaeota archaeon]|jgi:putative protease
MEGKLIGRVFNYFEHISVAAITLSGPLKLGDTIRIVGGDKDFTEVIDNIQINKDKVSSAKAGDKVGVKVSEKVCSGYKVYKVV